MDEKYIMTISLLSLFLNPYTLFQNDGISCAQDTFSFLAAEDSLPESYPTLSPGEHSYEKVNLPTP